MTLTDVMNILIDAHLCGRSLTGIGRYLKGLIPALLRKNHGHRISLAVLEGAESGINLTGIKQDVLLQCYPVSFRGVSPKQHIILPLIASKARADVYHHPHFDLPWLNSIPAIVTIHDLKYIRYAHFFPELAILKRLYIKKMMARSLRRAQKIVAVSEATKHDIMDVFQIPPEKIEVIYHGLDESFLEPCIPDDSKNVYRHDKPIPENYILFVGMRRPHKNIATLIGAFKLVTEHYSSDVHLVIVGASYADYHEPERMVEKLNLQSNVHFLGAVTDGQLRQYYTQALMFILPSLYEGFGLPLLEAMGLGTPVIGSNISSIPEIIGDAGLLCNPNNIEDIAEKIMRLLDDESLRLQLIEMGRNRARQFTWETASAKMFEIYEEVYRK
jgi:glycosyltransferase involved in cell wall biosynthesis